MFSQLLIWWSLFTRSQSIKKINKYTLCFWSRTTERVWPLTLSEGWRGGQTMSVWPNIGWSRLGGNCCVQSMMVGLKRPQQRSWKNDTRFFTTPRLQRDSWRGFRTLTFDIIRHFGVGYCFYATLFHRTLFSFFDCYHVRRERFCFLKRLDEGQIKYFEFYLKLRGYQEMD